MGKKKKYPDGGPVKPKTKGSANFKTRKPPVEKKTEQAPFAHSKDTETRAQYSATQADVQNWFTNYIKSPKYEERLRGMGHSPLGVNIVPTIVKDRLNRVKNFKTKFIGGEESSGVLDVGNIIEYNPIVDGFYGSSSKYVVPHEISHYVGSMNHEGRYTDGWNALNLKETQEINKRNKFFHAWPEHDARAWEAKPDFDALRYNLHKKGIYNAGKEDFTPEHLKKIKDKSLFKDDDTILNRIFTYFDDEDIIWIMNNIAKNEQPQQKTMAKAGKKIKLDGGGPLKAKQNRPSKWEPPTNPTYKPLEAVTVTPPKMPTLDYSQPDFGETYDFGGRPDIMKETGSEQISTNYYQAMMDSIIPTKEPAGKKRNVNYGQLATMGLLAANALIPEDKPRRTVVQPQRGYNPNPYGTGSQAIFKAGGKMPDGGSVPTGGMYTNPTDSARDDIDMSELISTYIASGGIEEEGRKALFQRLSDKYGAKGAQDLFTEMSLFSQDAGNKSLAAPDKITRFFSLPSNANIKKDLNRFGYGAANIYDTASNVVAQKQQGRGLLTKMDAGGSLEKISPSTVEFVGKSHKKGGIDIAYAGQEVEVEGGETGTFSPDGTLNIMGNMKVMGTNKTFKQMSKSLARKENKYMSLMNKANDVSAGADTGAMIDRLKRNSAHLLSLGAEKGIADVHEKKEMLSEMQNAQLAMAEEGGYDPIAFSEGKKKKARKGMRIFAEPGASVGDPEKPKKKSVAQRHNNPGNIKWNPKLKWMEKLGAVKGEPATDGGYFAHFPDTNKGLTAIRELLKRGYGKYDVESGLKRWTGGTGYNLDLGGLKGKKIKDLSATELDSLVSTITYGEDGRYYSPEATPASTAAQEIITPTLPGLPNRTITNDVKTAAPQTSTVNPPPLGSVKNPQARSIESDIQPMSLEQVLPEIFALARNKVQPVAAQQYTPELLQDYEISLQDRRNENTSVFNAMQRTIGNNPAALSSLAGQLYGANNQVSAEEFRINQANENGIRNQNTEMLNQAEQLNLRLADEQYKRQSMAQSKTDAYNQMILNSISSKSLQHTANNRKLAIYENLYDFRYKDTNNDGIQDTATYEGPEHQFYSNGQAVESTPNRYADTTIIRDGQGNVKGSRVRVPSKARQEAQELDIQRKTNSVPFLRKLLRSL